MDQSVNIPCQVCTVTSTKGELHLYGADIRMGRGKYINL